MENYEEPNAQLELGNESNPPMPEENAIQAEPRVQNESPVDFFNRVLSDGQTEQDPASGVEGELEVPEAEMPQDTTEAEEAETQEVAQQGGLTKGAQKRIDKLTALRREAEEKAQKLEAELAELKRSKAAPVPKSNNPYGHLEDEASIQAEYEKMRQVRLFCERYPDGYYPENGEPISKDQIAETKVKALRALEEQLPAQVDYITRRNQVSSVVRKEFNWLNDPTDERTQKVQKFVEAVPEIKRFPDYEVYAAHMVNGMMSYKAQKAAAQKANPRVPVQPTVSSSAAPQAQKASAVEGAASMERYRKTGSIDDLANVFKSKFL